MCSAAWIWSVRTKVRQNFCKKLFALPPENIKLRRCATNPKRRKGWGAVLEGGGWYWREGGL